MDFDFLHTVYHFISSFFKKFLIWKAEANIQKWLEKITLKRIATTKGSLKKLLWKFRRIHMKTPLPEPLYNKPAGRHLY